jgi:regulatory protein
VQDELARLEAVGLIDDEAFARALAEHHLGVRASGRRAVAAALASKGVSRGTIDQVLAELETDDAARAESLAAEKARRFASLPPEKAYGRLVALLARRGYEAGIARLAARRALDLDAGSS